MRHSYHELLDARSLAVIDLIEMGDDFLGIEGMTWLVSRINVPLAYRRRGIGNRLLAQVLEDADYEEIILILEPAASGTMSQADLIEWYERNGFVEDSGNDYYIRMPQKEDEPVQQSSQETVS